MKNDIGNLIRESMKTISLLYEQTEPIALATDIICKRLSAGNICEIVERNLCERV